MKARILALLAMVLGVVSCQTEPEGLDVNVGGEQEVAVCVSLPEATRANSALGAFDNVDLSGDATIRYILQIFDQNDRPSDAEYVKYSDEKSVVFPVRLVPGRDYRFVVWADYVDSEDDGDKHYNTRNAEDKIDLTNITLKDTWVAMDETRDAFTGYYDTADHNVKYSSTLPINITLKRPFAKLRVITTDMVELRNLGIEPPFYAEVEYATEYRAGFNAFTSKAVEAVKDVKKTHAVFEIANYDDNTDASKVLFTDYFFAEQDVVKFTLNVYEGKNANGEGTGLIKSNIFNTDIAAKRNYLTTIKGNILTDGRDVTVTVKDAFEGNVDYDSDKDEQTTTVNTAADLAEAFSNENIDVIVLNGDINLDDLLTRAAYTALTVKNGKTLTIDLNDNKLSANTYENSGNQELFLVKGTLSVKNGTIEYKHLGENMGWGSMTTIFDVTAGGVLNLEGVTAKNLGGSDMGFVAHLNNWGEVTLNVENSTLESNYVPVRVFNSGYDMNNVTIKNSTLTGVSAAFWVHNYTVADFGTEEKAEAQKALLNFDIYNGTNTFSPDLNGIRYGFTNAVRADAYGITKVVSEDGTEVVLGSMTDDGLVRRGVAGTEENTTITKAVVGEGITTLYDRTFRRFYALETVVLPSTLTTIGAAGSGVFQSCTALKEIVIPESVTVLGKGSFQECSSLESINIPAGVTRIEADALRATGLVSVEFHAGVTYFGAQAFRDCKQLTEVVINAPEFTMESNTFGIMAAPFTPMTIYVANAEMKAYVESKLTDHDKTYITVKAPATVTDKASLQEALDTAIAAGEKNIFIDATNFSGDMYYCFTKSNVPAGVTVTIRNANVTGSGRWNYANGTLIFDNCSFTAGVYSIHFDAGDAIVKFKNCNLVGWSSFGALTSVSFENCHLTGNGSYALIRSYADLTLKNCVIDTTLANHADGYTDGVQAIDATLTEENVTYIDNHTAYLQNVLKAGKHVVLSSDLTISSNEGITAPYGNKMALSQNGGVFDGNGKTITADLPGDNYIYMTNGGTTKNLNVTGAFRGIMIMSANQTVRLENVVSGGTGVVYALNTGEGDSTQDLVATNCTFNGWSSWDLIKSATFTNCIFGQGSEYSNVTGRLGRPYVNTVFDGCNFCSKYYIDLSALKADQKVTVKNCTVNGVKITAENWTSLVAPEDTCGEGQISVELKNGTFLTAENVADYIVFE